MSEQSTYPPPYIGLDELRNLLRPGRKMFLPDHVAQAIAEREQKLRPAEAAEIAEILTRLVDELRARLHDEGFEPPDDDESVEGRMPKRERDRAINLARLLALDTVALAMTNRLEEAERSGREAIGWARMAASDTAETRARIALAGCYTVAGRREEEERTLERAVAVARRSGDDSLLADALNELATDMVSRENLNRAEEVLEEAFALVESKLPEDRRTMLIPRLMLSKGRVAGMRKEQERAIATLREALHASDAERDPFIHTSILSQLGSAYSGLGDDHKALECLTAMTRIAEANGDAIPCSWGYFRIGEVHSNLEENRLAEKAFQLALLHSPEHYPLPRNYVLFKQSEICYREERTEEGIELCRRILDENAESWSPSFAVAVYTHLGLLEEQRGRPAEAETALRRAVDLSLRNTANDRSMNAKERLARILLKVDKEEEGEKLLRKVIEEKPRTLADERIIARAFRCLSEIVEERDCNEALRFSREQSEREREIARRQTEEALHKARILAEVELLEREAQFERERRRQAEQELAQAVLSLKGKSDVLEKVERQLHHVLSGIVAEKAREITASLKQMLQELDTKADASAHPLNYLQGIDQEFFVRLRARWPGMTRKQERLCGLIRAGLTAQEIASILNVSYEGVRAMRKRLRKQLRLESEASLEGVIAEV